MSSPLIHCIISADYELFLGRNFASDDEVLFGPTRKLMDVCDAAEVPLTLFADVCSVWAHRDSGLNDYADNFEGQLCSAIKCGHDVQLHLHPHWLNSQFTDGEWRLSTDQMYLSELGFGDASGSAPDVIARGVEYLNGLLTPERPSYRCFAFRAAGLALQPLESETIQALLDNGIVLDSSIIKNVRMQMDTIRMDYTGMPDAANWFMDPQTGLKVEASGGLLEVPIATFQSGLIDRLGFLWRRLHSLKMRRGAGISRSERQTPLVNAISMLKYNWRYVSTNPWFLFSCDTKGVSLSMLE